MRIKKTNFKDLLILNSNIIHDKRGDFVKIFSQNILNFFFRTDQIIYVKNNSKNTIRGFHFQKKPFEEKKIIHCIKGKLKLYCVDMRKRSKNFKKHFSIILEEKDNKSILIPKGFANAYITLEKDTRIIYLINGIYKKNYSGGFNFRSKFLKIKWPKDKLIISKRDKSLKFLKDL